MLIAINGWMTCNYMCISYMPYSTVFQSDQEHCTSCGGVVVGCGVEGDVVIKKGLVH